MLAMSRENDCDCWEGWSQAQACPFRRLPHCWTLERDRSQRQLDCAQQTWSEAEAPNETSSESPESKGAFSSTLGGRDGAWIGASVTVGSAGGEYIAWGLLSVRGAA